MNSDIIYGAHSKFVGDYIISDKKEEVFSFVNNHVYRGTFRYFRCVKTLKENKDAIQIMWDLKLEIPDEFYALDEMLCYDEKSGSFKEFIEPKFITTLKSYFKRE